MYSKESIIRAHQAIAPYITYIDRDGLIKRMSTEYGIKDCLQDLLALADHEGIDFTECRYKAEHAFESEKSSYE